MSLSKRSEIVVIANMFMEINYINFFIQKLKRKILLYKQQQQLENLKSMLKCNKCKGPIKNLNFLDATMPLTSKSEIF